MRRSSISIAVLAGLLIGCSSSTAPKPSIAGTWHLTLGALTSGTISPTSFDVTVNHTGSTYSVAMPTLTWSGGLTFDSGPNLAGFSDSTKAGFLEFTHAPHSHLCQFVIIGGVMNAAIDTLASAQITIEDADTVPGPYCPTPTVTGSATIHK